MADFKWLSDNVQKQITDIFQERADLAWGGKADDLLGSSASGKTFLEQLKLTAALLGERGIIATPRFDDKTQTVYLDMVNAATGAKAPRPLVLSLSGKQGGRHVNDSVLKGTWIAYKNSTNPGKNLTDAATYELLSLNNKLALDSRSSVSQAAKKKDIAEVQRLSQKIMREATRKIYTQNKRSRNEIEDENRRAVNTKSAAARMRDDRMVDMSSLVTSIARNVKKEYGNWNYSAIGRTSAQRRDTLDKDVKDILAALSISRNPSQTAATLINRYAKKYSKAGAQQIINEIMPFASLGLEVTNISNGAYSAGRFGSVTANKTGHYFAAPSNVHFRQADNYNPRQKAGDSKKRTYVQAAKRNPLTTQSLVKYGDKGGSLDNPEELLMTYLEVSQKDFNELRASYIEETVQKELIKRQKTAQKKQRTLSDKEKKQIRKEVVSRFGGLSNAISQIGSDSFGINTSLTGLLDDYMPKNINILEQDIKKSMTHYQSHGGWKKRASAVSRSEAVKDIIAQQIAGKHKSKVAEVKKFLSDITENPDGAKDYGDGLGSSNFTYHLNRNFKVGDKILGSQGDRMSTIGLADDFLTYVANKRGISGKKIFGISTGPDKLNARNFEEWFLPRMMSLAVAASERKHTAKLANQMNALLKKSLPEGAYANLFGDKGNYFQVAGNRLVRNDLGLSDIFYKAYGSDSGKRASALQSFLLGWGDLFKSKDFGIGSKTGLLTRGTDGELLVNQDVNKMIPLYASFNAIAKDWYGPASVSGAVHLDRRAEYAMRRELAEAGHMTGRDMSGLRAAWGKQLKTPITQEELSRRQEAFKEAFGMSVGGLAAPAGAKVFNARDWEKASKGETSGWVNGRYLAKAFLNSPLGKIWEDYDQYKKSHGGDASGYQALVNMPLGYDLDLGDGEIRSGNSIAVPNYILESLGIESHNGVDYVTGLGQTQLALNKVFENALEAGREAASAKSGSYKYENYNNSIADVFAVLKSDLYDSSGDSWAAANKALLGRSFFMALNKAEDTDYLSSILGPRGAEVANQIATSGALISAEDAKTIYGGNPLREKGETKAQYRQKLLARRNYLLNDFERIYGGADDETKRKVYGLIGKNLSQNRAFSAPGEKGRFSKEAWKAKKKAFQDNFDFNSVFGNNKASSDQLIAEISALSAYNLAGVDVDNPLFQGLTGGLSMSFARNPFTEGKDLIFANAYLSSKLGKQRGYLAPGFGWRSNADFDGDQIAAAMALGDPAILGKSREEIKELYDDVQALTAIRAQKAAFAQHVAGFGHQQANGLKLGLADASTMTDLPALSLAEWAGKRVFGNTGRLDNIRQRMSYNLSLAMLDELGYGAENDPGKAVDALITRHIFESMSQDAISSKKILDRYSKKGGGNLSEEDAYHEFVGEFDELLNSISKNERFQTTGDFKPFIDKLMDMGILDENGFDERITTTILQDIGATTASRKYFYENYLKDKHKAAFDGISDSELEKIFDTKNTSLIQWHDWLNGKIGARDDNGNLLSNLVRLTPDMLVAALKNENSHLTAAVKQGKLYLPGDSGEVLGRALLYSSAMPGKEEQAPFKNISGGDGYSGGSGGSHSSDPMTKAADTLLKAAEALLKLAGGAGGGGGRGYGVGGVAASDADYVPYTKMFSGTQVAALLRPGRKFGGDSSGFVETVLNSKGKANLEHLGYNSQKALEDAFGSWWGSVRGTQVGNLTEMILDAEKFGIVTKDENEKLLSLSDIRKNIENEAFVSGKGSTDEFQAWKKRLYEKGDSGTDKSFLAQYDTFNEILEAIGDENLSKLIKSDKLNSAADIREQIGANVVTQYKQLKNTLGSLTLGIDKQSATGHDTLGTEVELRAALEGGIGLKGFLDNLSVVSSEGHKALASFDFKRIASGIPSEENVLQMWVYQTILDDLTEKIKDSWDGTESEKTALARFKKTRYGEMLNWTEDDLKKLKGLDTDAIVGMSVVDENNQSRSYQLQAYGAAKEQLKRYLLNPVLEGKTLDDLTMSVFSGYVRNLTSGETLNLSDDLQKGIISTLSGYAKRYVGHRNEVMGLESQISRNKELLKGGLYRSEEEREKLVAQNKSLKLEIKGLNDEFREYRDNLAKTAEGEEELMAVEKAANKELKARKKALEKANDDYVQKYRMRMTKSEEKSFESLLAARNQQMAGYNADSLALNKTNDSLQRRALAQSMRDRLSMIDEYNEQIEDAKQNLRGLGVEEDKIASIEEKYSKRLDLMNDQLMVRNKGITNLWESLGTSFKMMITRFTQMGLAYSILNKFKKAFGEVTQSAAQLNKVMTGLRIVTGDSYEDAHKLMSGYADLASQLAATTVEVATAGQEWLRQGYDVAKVNELITSSIQLSTLGMMSAGDATKALTSAMKGFKMEASQASEIVDKFTTLDMRAATTAGDIATALSKFATTAQMAGLDIDQASAMATTIMDISQSDAGATGNALKTILSRYGNVKAGTFQSMSLGDSDDTTDKINDIERVLNTLGIQVRTSAREMRDFDDVLADIAEKWGYLDKVSQNAIATALAGTRQREAFAVLMNNYDRYRELLEVSQNSEGMAAKKYQSYLESLEASQKRLKAAWEDFANESGIAEFLTNLNNMIAPFVKNWLPSIIKYVSKLIFTLNSYKYPKILAGLFSPGKGMIGNSLFGLTSAGMQQKASQYSLKSSFDFVFKGLSGASGKASTSLDTLANAALKAAGALNGSKAEGGGGKRKTDLVDANGNPIYVESAPSAGAAGVDASAAAQAPSANGAASFDPSNYDFDADFSDYYGPHAKLYGNYTAADRKQAWAKKRKELRDKRRHAVNKALFSPSAEGAMMGAAYAAASIAEGASIGQQGMNYYNGQMQKASNGANAAATINSVGSAVGYIWGPIVGTLTTTAADLLNKFLIIPLFDWQENEKKAREELLSKVSEQLNALDNSFSKLSSVSKLSELTGEQYKEMYDTVSDFLKNVYAKENAGMKRALTDKLMELIGGQKIGNREITSVKDITDAYLEGSQKDRELIINLLMASQTIAKARTDYSLAKSQMGNTDFIIKVAPFSVDPFTGKGHGKDVLNILSRNGMEFDQTVRGAGGSGEYKSTGTLEDNILALEKALNNLTEEEERYRGVLSDYLADLKNQQTQLESIRKEYNVAIAKAGILTAQNAYGDALLSTSNRSLKNMGIEEIKRIIAEEIKEEGGLVGHDLYDPNGKLTQYAEEVISQVIRENPLLNGILTGSSYTLRDLLVMKGGKTEDELRKDELVASFASALNIGVEEFIEKMKDGTLLNEYGNLSLGALTKTAEETRSTISALCSIMDELNSATGLTAEGLETLLSQFPELVKYVGDEGSLNAAIINNLEDYKKDYARKTYRSIMSNEGVFEQFDYDLSQNEYMQQLVDDPSNPGKQISRYELLSRGEYGNASTLEDIKKMLWGNPEDYGLTAEEQEILRKQYAEIFDNIDTDKIVDQKIAQTMSSYLKKANEREIKALEEQKQALQDINKQREYENKLIEARNRLEEAGKEKKRVWREGVGWVYESDQEALKEAQKNLEEVENEKNIRELELQIEQLQAWNEALDKVFDDSEFENLKKSYDAWAESNGLIATSMHTLIMEIAGLQNGTGAENSNVHQTAFEDAPAASAEQIAKAEAAGGRLSSEYDELLDAEAEMEAAAREHGKHSRQYLEAQKNYYDKLQTYQNTADEAEGSTAAKNFYEAEGHEDAAGYRQKSLPEDELGWVFMGLSHVHGSSNDKNRSNYRKGVLLDSNDNTYTRIQMAFKGKDDWIGYYYDPDNYSQEEKDSGFITSLGQPKQIDSDKFAKVYDGSLSSWIMAKGKNGMILSGGNYKGVVWNKELYYLQAAAQGSLGLPGGPTLLNELGTEAVVTPYGTVTSLPSGSGVVPADVTKNLWALGDVAPSLLRLLEIARPTLASGSADNHSLSVGVINMDVHADKDFDVDTWVSQLRNAAYLKKNS